MQSRKKHHSSRGGGGGSGSSSAPHEKSAKEIERAKKMAERLGELVTTFGGADIPTLNDESWRYFVYLADALGEADGGSSKGLASLVDGIRSGRRSRFAILSLDDLMVYAKDNPKNPICSHARGYSEIHEPVPEELLALLLVRKLMDDRESGLARKETARREAERLRQLQLEKEREEREALQAMLRGGGSVGAGGSGGGSGGGGGGGSGSRGRSRSSAGGSKSSRSARGGGKGAGDTGAGAGQDHHHGHEGQGGSGSAAAGKESSRRRRGGRHRSQPVPQAAAPELESVQDEPADGPDMYLWLRGFPLTVSFVSLCHTYGIPLAAVAQLEPHLERRDRGAYALVDENAAAATARSGKGSGGAETRSSRRGSVSHGSGSPRSNQTPTPTSTPSHRPDSRGGALSRSASRQSRSRQTSKRSQSGRDGTPSATMRRKRRKDGRPGSQGGSPLVHAPIPELPSSLSGVSLASESIVSSPRSLPYNLARADDATPKLRVPLGSTIALARLKAAIEAAPTGSFLRSLVVFKVSSANQKPLLELFDEVSARLFDAVAKSKAHDQWMGTLAVAELPGPEPELAVPSGSLRTGRTAPLAASKYLEHLDRVAGDGVAITAGLVLDAMVEQVVFTAQGPGLVHDAVQADYAAALAAALDGPLASLPSVAPVSPVAPTTPVAPVASVAPVAPATADVAVAVETNSGASGGPDSSELVVIPWHNTLWQTYWDKPAVLDIEARLAGQVVTPARDVARVLDEAGVSGTVAELRNMEDRALASHFLTFPLAVMERTLVLTEFETLLETTLGGVGTWDLATRTFYEQMDGPTMHGVLASLIGRDHKVATQVHARSQSLLVAAIPVMDASRARQTWWAPKLSTSLSLNHFGRVLDGGDTVPGLVNSPGAFAFEPPLDPNAPLSMAQRLEMAKKSAAAAMSGRGNGAAAGRSAASGEPGSSGVSEPVTRSVAYNVNDGLVHVSETETFVYPSETDTSIKVSTRGSARPPLSSATTHVSVSVRHGETSRFTMHKTQNPVPGPEPDANPLDEASAGLAGSEPRPLVPAELEASTTIVRARTSEIVSRPVFTWTLSDGAAAAFTTSSGGGSGSGGDGGGAGSMIDPRVVVSTADGVQVAARQVDRTVQLSRYTGPVADSFMAEVARGAGAVAGEAGRVVQPSGTILVYGADGHVAVYAPTGAMSTYSPTTQSWVHTTASGAVFSSPGFGGVQTSGTATAQLVVSTFSNPETQVTTATREDGLIIETTQNTHTVTFPDGTVVAADAVDAERAQTLRISGPSSLYRDVALTVDVDGLATSVAIPATGNLQGLAVEVDSEVLRVKHGQAWARVESKSGKMLYGGHGVAEYLGTGQASANCVYTFDVVSGSLRVLDRVRNEFSVDGDTGAVAQTLAAERAAGAVALGDDDPESDDELAGVGSGAESRDARGSAAAASRMVLQELYGVDHPPRLFVVRGDGSGYELIEEAVAVGFLQSAEAAVAEDESKGTSLSVEALAGDTQSTCFTFLTQLGGSSSGKSDGPNAPRRLRQLTRHAQLNAQQRETLFEELDAFAAWQAERQGQLDKLALVDVRTVSDREAQAAITARILAMRAEVGSGESAADDAATDAAADAAVVATDAADPAMDEEEEEKEEMEAGECGPQRYFDTELGKAFLASQSRTLSLEQGLHGIPSGARSISRASPAQTRYEPNNHLVVDKLQGPAVVLPSTLRPQVATSSDDEDEDAPPVAATAIDEADYGDETRWYEAPDGTMGSGGGGGGGGEGELRKHSVLPPIGGGGGNVVSKAGSEETSSTASTAQTSASQTSVEGQQQQQQRQQRRRRRDGPRPKVLRGSRGDATNTEYLERELPVRRFVKTSSVMQAKAKGAAVARRMFGFEMYPEELDMGVLAVSAVYRLGFKLRNVGVESARFKVRQPSTAGMRVRFVPGPVAPGMAASLELEFSLPAETNLLGEVLDEIVVTTEADVFHVPVSARVVTFDEARALFYSRGGTSIAAPGVKRVPVRQAGPGSGSGSGGSGSGSGAGGTPRSSAARQRRKWVLPATPPAPSVQTL